MKIEPITYKQLLSLKSLEREGLDFKYYPNAVYLGAFVDDQLVGCVGFQRVGKSMRYKTDGVLPAYRGYGIYSALWKAREEMNSAVTVTAYCTAKSLPMYLNHGFEALSVNKKNGVTFVKRVSK